MADEFTTEDTVDVDTTVEIAQDEFSPETEGSESVEGTTEDQPFRAWELPKPEPKQPANIPYERFQSVNKERNDLFEDNRALAARIAELEKAQEKLAEVPDPDDINIDDYATPQEYLKARDKAIAARVRADIQADLAQREQASLETQQRTQIATQYMSAIETQTAEDPNVANAKAFFDTYAEAIPPVVGRELLLDPNIGHVMVRLTTNKQQLLDFFDAAQSNPGAAIKMIHKISARIDVERETKPAPRAQAPEQRRAPAPDPRAAVRAAMPAVVKPAPSASRLDLYKDAGNMSLAQYRKLREGKR